MAASLRIDINMRRQEEDEINPMAPHNCAGSHEMCGACIGCGMFFANFRIRYVVTCPYVVRLRRLAQNLWRGLGPVLPCDLLPINFRKISIAMCFSVVQIHTKRAVRSRDLSGVR